MHVYISKHPQLLKDNRLLTFSIISSISGILEIYFIYLLLSLACAHTHTHPNYLFNSDTPTDNSQTVSSSTIITHKNTPIFVRIQTHSCSNAQSIEDELFFASEGVPNQVQEASERAPKVTAGRLYFVPGS